MGSRTHHRAVVLLASVLLAVALGLRPRPVAPRAPAPAPALAAAPATLDVNTATAGELEQLPGVGPSLAARIADDRARRGPFATLEDLDRVRGIGRRMIERLRPWARASPTDRASSAAPPTR